MNDLYVMTSVAGPHRDLAKGSREQPFWDEHAEFIDRLVAEGFIVMGGPFVDDGGAMLIVRAEDEGEVRGKTKRDPWYTNGILRLQSIRRWQVFIDEWDGHTKPS
jgi:uncharacterized protein YciI